MDLSIKRTMNMNRKAREAEPMNNENKTKKKTEVDEVDELLRAAEDELLLNLSLNSHMSRVSPSYIDPDLDRRFQVLKSSSSPPNTNPQPQDPKLKDPALGKVQTPPQPHLDVDHEDLLARFAALKGSVSDSTAAAAYRGDGSDEEEEEEDEVEKVIRWAMDAARLENSLPTQQLDTENRKSSES